MLKTIIASCDCSTIKFDVTMQRDCSEYPELPPYYDAWLPQLTCAFCQRAISYEIEE